MNILIYSLFSIYCLLTFAGLYVFHNVFIELMHFSFQDNFNKFLYFLSNYFGLIVFSLIWGAGIYLGYIIFTLAESDMLFIGYVLLYLCFMTSLAISILDAIFIQFSLSSLWKKESPFCNFISNFFIILISIIVASIGLWGSLSNLSLAIYSLSIKHLILSVLGIGTLFWLSHFTYIFFYGYSYLIIKK